MGKLILEKAVSVLREAGFAADRGYPAEKMIHVTGPVCAVNLLQADLRQQTATVKVMVFTPMELGGAACEETTLSAAEALSQAGGKCSVETLQVEAKQGLFSMGITAQFYTAIPKILIGEEELENVTAFTSWRGVDELITDIDHAPWCFRLEEFFPVGVEEPPEPDSPFALMHVNAQGAKIFTGCVWTYQRRVWSADGIRQIRLGQAEDMQDG